MHGLTDRPGEADMLMDKCMFMNGLTWVGRVNANSYLSYRLVFIWLATTLLLLHERTLQQGQGQLLVCIGNRSRAPVRVQPRHA